MCADDKMTIDERRKYLRKMQKRYRQATREGKTKLLDEMQVVTELHRKSLLRLLHGDLRRKPRHKQRGRTYGREVAGALRVIAESVDWLCAERLQPNLVWLATHLAQHGELELSDALLARLEQVSVSTVRRLLERSRQDQPRLPRKGPARANRLARAIPARRIAWDEPEPGHFEVDLVHHCGASSAGQYIHTLQLVDVATGWSERVAVLDRSYLVMEHAFRRVLARLPFPVRELHPDNGPEFLNNHLLRFWKETVKGLQLSRSRPYQKNDNRFVEQKNDTLVRAYLGHVRLDTVAQTQLLNQLYDQLWLYYNLFQPVMRLAEKTRLSENGRTRVKRRFDRAQTPCDRLCASGVLTPQVQANLLALRDTINPRMLRQDIYDRLDRLFALPNAVPGQTEDVRATLLPLPDQNGAGLWKSGQRCALAHFPTAPTATSTLGLSKPEKESALR